MPAVRCTREADSDAAPHLKPFLTMGNLNDLPDFSAGPRGDDRTVYQAIKDAGYEGIQGGDAKLAHDVGLLFAGGGRVNEPADAQRVASQAVDAGAVCATCHVGWGIEDDSTIDKLVGAILDAASKHDMPIYIETHRATITQDMQRTVSLVRRFPEVRFNGDFSHWYTGLEMPYGTMERKMEFAKPVFDRVRFMHGRIGSSGCMQVNIGDTLEQARGHDFVQHFQLMWTAAMRGFKNDAGQGDYLIFAPELLDSRAYYARKFPTPQGELVEESDRWTQALLYVELAKQCFDKA